MKLLSKFVDHAVESLVSEEARRRADNLDNEYLVEKQELDRGFNIPIEFNTFPIFDGVIESLSKEENKEYQSCTIKYYNLSEDLVNNYRDKVILEGYKKIDDIKYQKDNHYLTIDYQNNLLTIIYYIKL